MKMLKLIRRIVLAVVLLVIVAIVVVWLMLDSLAKAGLEKGASYALGVETRAEKVHLSVLRSELTIQDLDIANPAGFRSPDVMRAGRFELKLEPLSVFGNTIKLQKFELDGLDVNIEQKLTGSNISKIIDNLKRFNKDGKAKSEGKKVRVDRILIKNVVAQFHLLSDVADTKPLTVRVPEIELTDVATDQSGGLVVGQLVSRVVPAVLAAVLRKGQGIIPSDLHKDLNGQLAGLTDALGQQAAGLLRQAEGQVTEGLKKEADKLLPGLVDRLTKDKDKPK